MKALCTVLLASSSNIEVGLGLIHIHLYLLEFWDPGQTGHSRTNDHRCLSFLENSKNFGILEQREETVSVSTSQ